MPTRQQSRMLSARETKDGKCSVTYFDDEIWFTDGGKPEDDRGLFCGDVFYSG